MSDDTVSALARKAEATGSPADAEKALVAKIRDGDEAAKEQLEELEAKKLRARPISEWSVWEILETRLPYGSSTEDGARYFDLEHAREAINDEIAAARVAARKGLPPEAAWRVERVRVANGVETREEDPRLVAWKGVAWDRVRESSRALGAWLPSEAPGLDELVRIERALDVGARALSALRKTLEGDAAK